MGALPKPKYLTLAVQAVRMSQLFPNFNYSWSSGTGIWTGSLQPSSTSPKYLIQIKYKQLDRPIVRVLRPQICENAPHVYSDGSLCLYYRDGSWTRSKVIAETILSWAAEWLFFYEYWQATGKWLGPEAQHTGNKKVLTDL